MKVSDSFSLFSHLLNFAIFIYFVIFLLKLHALNMFGLFISAFGIPSSLITNILSIIER